MSFPKYPKYQISGALGGEIPAHWTLTPLKRLVRIENGADYKHVEAVEGYPVIGSGGAFAYASEYMYDGDSVLFGRKGTIDRPLMVSGKFWTIDTMYWTRMLESHNARFMYYVACTIPFKMLSTDTALPSMTKEALYSYLVLIPSRVEELAIAAFLDRETAKIDALIAEQERLIELLKEKRQAAISQAVTRGLNSDARTKPSGVRWIGEVPAHWQVAPLKRVWSVTDCKHVTADFVDDGVPVVSIREVQGWYVNLADAQRTTASYFNALIEGGRLPRAGDLVLSRNATVGQVAQVPDAHQPFALGQDVCLLRKLDSRDSSDFMQFVFRSSVIVGQLETIMIGSTFKRVNVQEVKSLMVPVPPAAEQARISTWLRKECGHIDTLVIAASDSIQLLAERRSALVSAAVAGQIDVPTLAKQKAA